MASAIVIFRTIDTDHSDSITIEEFKAYWDVSFAAMFDHHCFAEAALLVCVFLYSVNKLDLLCPSSPRMARR